MTKNTPEEDQWLAKVTVQIIHLLREVEIHASEGKNIAQATLQIEVSEQTNYRWRKENGGLNIGQVMRLKDLDKEHNSRKNLVADFH